MSFFDLLYRFIFYPLLRVVFTTLAFFNPKIRDGLEMRKAQANGRPPWLQGAEGTRPIVIHCASGEFEYAKPVIREIKRRSPEIRVMVTYFSPTMADTIAKFEGVDFSTPIPWDSSAHIKKFIDYHRPRAILFARTDTWPELIRLAEKMRIPTLLFSATLTEISGRAQGLGAWVSSNVFPRIDEIFAVTDEDTLMFRKLDANAETKGDTRFDQVIERLKTAKPIRDELFSSIDDRITLTAGSTWPEDETVLIEVASQLKGKVRWVLVPHEPTEDHLKSLEDNLKAKGLKFDRYSKAKSFEEILLVDQTGILAELYQKGDFAFVGGSFKKTVHSVMEPLAAGCLTFVGPLHINNREALAFKSLPAGASDLKCVEVVRSPADWVQRLNKACDKLKTTPFHDSIRNEVISRTGATKAVVDWIESLPKT